MLYRLLSAGLLLGICKGLEFYPINDPLARLYPSIQLLSQRITVQSDTYSSLIAAQNAFMKMRVASVELQVNTSISKILENHKNASGECKSVLGESIAKIEASLKNLIDCDNYHVVEAYKKMIHFRHLNEKLQSIFYQKVNSFEYTARILNEIPVDLGVTSSSINLNLEYIGSSTCPEYHLREINKEIARVRKDDHNCLG